MGPATVEVRAFCDLAQIAGGTTSLAVPSPGDGATVRSLARELGVAEGRVGLAMVNGRIADLDAAVEPGDRVALFPEYVPYHKVYGMCVL